MNEYSEPSEINDDKMIISNISSCSSNSISSLSYSEKNESIKMINQAKIINKRFYVRSLGWVKIDEGDLTSERSSKAVNKCINDLSRGFRDLNDVVSRWGEV